MHKGTVKWFNDLKGYGFITSIEIPQELFVKFTEICASGYRTLKKGDHVLFEIDSADAKKAVNVTKI